MRGKIKAITRRELTAAIQQRYEASDRNGKKLILDEFVKVTGYHRKHAIRVLAAPTIMVVGRSVGYRVYKEAVKEAMIVLWEASDRICGKRGRRNMIVIAWTNPNNKEFPLFSDPCVVSDPFVVVHEVPLSSKVWPTRRAG